MLKRRNTRKFRRVPRFKGQTVSKLIPNLITVGATCAGLTGVRFALDEKWEYAVIAVGVAAVLDGLDGSMARLLKSASDFGAELDSLSDFVAFGVSPALILYFWSLDALGGIGWAITLFLAICCALRLARFNTNIGKLPPYAYNYFTGVPAPMGAALALLPMIASFEFGREIIGHPILLAAWTSVVALLMVSQVPTYSLKKVKIPQFMVLPVVVAAVLLLVGLAGAPWRTLTFALLVYIASFGVSMWSYRRLRIEAERMQEQRDEEEIGGGPGAAGDNSEPTRLRPVK
jgi:CDP-diacylglycerol--serine O-phosphatidyltransferase